MTEINGTIKYDNEMYRLITENANDLIAILKASYTGFGRIPKFEFEYINEATHQKLLGYSSGDLIGKTILPMVHPEDLSEVVKLFLAILKKGEGTAESRLRKKDGTDLWVEFKARLFTTKNGEEKLLTITRDITERKLADKKLRESEEKYRLITENANDLIALLNQQNQYEYVNEAVYQRILGYSKEDLLGKNALVFVHPDHQERVVEAMKKASQVGEGAIEAKFKHKDGHFSWLEMKGRIFLDNAGISKGIITSRDITTRKQAEQKLRESEEKYRLMTENANDLIGILNQKFEMEYVSDIIEEMSGFSKKDLIGKSPLEFIHPDDQERVLLAMAKGFKVGEGIVELRATHKDGHYFWLEMRGRTYTTKEGEVKAIIISRDISERKKAEEEIFKSNARLEYLLSSSPATIYSAKPEPNYEAIFVSKNVEAMTGYKSEEFLNDNDPDFWLDRVHPEDRKYALHEVSRLAEKGTHSYQYRFKHKDGNYIWVRDSMKLICDSKGFPLDIVGYWSNITENKQAEEALHRSVEQYRRLVENMNDGLVIVNKEGIFTYANERLCGMLGYSRDEIVGKAWPTFFDEENREIVRFHLDKREKGEESSYEIAWIKKDGQKIYTIVSGQPNIAEEGRYEGAFAVVTDITERKRAEEDLRIKDNAIKASLSGIAITDMEANLTYVNPAFLRMWGYNEAKEILGGSGIEFWQMEEQAAEALQTLQEKGIWSGELRAKRREGITRDFRISAGTITDKAGNPQGIIASFMDITERKQAEEALKESEEKYRTLVETMTEGLVVQDAQGIITYVNPKIGEMLEYSFQELIGKHWKLFVHEDAIRTLEPQFAKRRKGEATTYEIAFRTKTGSEIDVIMSGKPILDAEGNYQGSLAVVTDITSRKRAEEALRESEEKFRTLVENAPDFIFEADPEGKVLFINRTYPEHVVEDVIGKSIYEFMMPEYQVSTRSAIKNLFQTASPWEFKHKSIGPNNDIRFLFTRYVPIMHGKKVVTFMGITSDITEREKAEEELKASEEKYKEMVELLPDSVFETNINLEITYANSMALQKFGYTQEELDNRNSVFQMVSPTERERTKRGLEVILMGVVGRPADYLMRRKDGSEFYARVFVAPIYKEGEIVGTRGVISDITERKLAEQKLKESEEQFKMLAEQALMGIFVLQDGLIKYVNDAASTITGYSIQEMLEWAPNYFIKLVHPEDASLAMEQARKKQAGEPGTIEHFYYRIYSKSGQMKWISNYSKSISYKGRTADLITLIDISERKKTEQDLKESEEQFKTISEQSLMGIIVLQDGVIKYVNEAAAAISEYSIQEILEWPLNYFGTLIHPDHRSFVMEQARKKQVGEPEVISHYYYKLLSKSGKMKWLSQYSKTIPYQGMLADLVTIIDISERKEAERKLNESEEHFKTISEQALMGICILQENVIQYINQQYANNFGYSINEMLSWGPLEFMKGVHPEDEKMILEEERKKRDAGVGASVHYSFRGIKKTGVTIWLDNHSKRIIYRGKPADLVMVTDITAKMEAEENLRQSEKQYREAFNRAEFYKDLLSHDVSNILQSIVFSAESGLLILDEKEKLRTKLNDIKDQIRRSAKVISSVRKLSKLEKGESHVQSIEVIKVLKNAMNFIQKGEHKKEIEVSFDTPQPKLFVQANELLRDVAENIIQNAVKYNQNPLVKVLIRISKEQKDNIPYLKIEFLDNGIGVQDISKKAIFERGYREEQNVTGRGLGLSLSSKIITSYNGQIWVEDRVKSDYSKGSNFIILIPEATTPA